MADETRAPVEYGSVRWHQQQAAEVLRLPCGQVFHHPGDHIAYVCALEKGHAGDHSTFPSGGMTCLS